MRELSMRGSHLCGKIKVPAAFKLKDLNFLMFKALMKHITNFSLINSKCVLNF
jgi:hypothetical protein